MAKIVPVGRPQVEPERLRADLLGPPRATAFALQRIYRRHDDSASAALRYVLSFDGKGIAMRHANLREATRKAAEAEQSYTRGSPKVRSPTASGSDAAVERPLLHAHMEPH